MTRGARIRGARIGAAGSRAGSIIPPLVLPSPEHHSVVQHQVWRHRHRPRPLRTKIRLHNTSCNSPCLGVSCSVFAGRKSPDRAFFATCAEARRAQCPLFSVCNREMTGYRSCPTWYGPVRSSREELQLFLQGAHDVNAPPWSSVLIVGTSVGDFQPYFMRPVQ